MHYTELEGYENDLVMRAYYEYYAKAKYAAEKMGLDVLINDEHDAKVVEIENFKMVLVDNVILIFVDGKRIFYYDPDENEIEVANGGWMKIVDILYQTVIDVEGEKKPRTK